MYTFVFASSVRLCLQTMLPLSWQRAIPKNSGPSSRTFKPMTMQVSITNFFIMASGKQWQVFFENFCGEAFGTLIWDIEKSTFFKNTFRNVIILIIKTLKFHFFELCWRQCRQGNYCFYDLFFHCEEALTFFKFENVY